MEDDFGSMWKEVKQERQAKRSRNRENSLRLLQESGLKVDVHNSGAHLVVYANHRTYDFWPGTGLFRLRGSGQSYRGVKRLLSFIADGRG